MKHYQNWTGRHAALAVCGIACVAAVGIPSWRPGSPGRRPRPDRPSRRRARQGRRRQGRHRSVVVRAETPTCPVYDAPCGASPAGDENPTISLAGRISTRTVRLTARTPGNVRDVRVHDGQHVKAGELLISLDDTVDALQVQAAEADLKQKQVQLNRVLKLYQDQQKHGDVNPEIDEAKANVQMAEIAVKYRKAIQEQYRVVAPFDGVITNLKAEMAIGGQGDGPQRS